MVSLLVEAVSLACVTYFAVTPCKRRRRSVVRGAISGAALASNRGLTALRCCCGCLDRLRLRVGSLCDADHDQRRREGEKAKHTRRSARNWAIVLKTLSGFVS